MSDKLEDCKKVIDAMIFYNEMLPEDESMLYWLLKQAERSQELKKERNEYKNALHEVRKFPTYMTKGQYVARGTKISNKVLKKWSNTNA